MSHWRLSPGIAARSSPTSSRTPGRDRATARQGQTDGAAHESQRGQPIGVGRRAVRGSRYWGTAFEARPSSRVRRLRRRPAPIVVPDCAPQPRARSWPRQTPDTTRARSRPRCHPSTSERPVVVKGWRPPQLESSSPHLNRNRLGPRHRRAHRRHPACLPRQHDQPEARVVEADAPRVLPHDGYQVASFAAPTAPPSLTSRCPPPRSSWTASPNGWARSSAAGNGAARTHSYRNALVRATRVQVRTGDPLLPKGGERCGNCCVAASCTFIRPSRSPTKQTASCITR